MNIDDNIPVFVKVWNHAWYRIALVLSDLNLSVF